MLVASLYRGLPKRLSGLMSNVALTVLFATRNGAGVLPRTLEGYSRVEAPPHGWKMVVVDNGSEDSTGDILTSFAGRLPLEVYQEEIAGKNRALNRGLNACEGSLTVITDDDAIPDRTFLQAWCKFLHSRLDYQLFGGSIDLFFETLPPKWLMGMSQLDMMFAVRDLCEGPIAADAIFGPNMAVRRSIFDAGFRFNENIGPNGSEPDYPMGSETEFCCRVAQAGAKAWFARGPRVQHIVRSSQLTRGAWIGRAYRHGRGVARRAWESGQAAPLGSPMRERLSHLRHSLQRFFPLSRQRYNSLWMYHWKRGFRDEEARRIAAAHSGAGR